MKTNFLESSKGSLPYLLSLLVLSGFGYATAACGPVDREDVDDWIDGHKKPDPVNPCAAILCKAGTQCVVNKTNPPSAQCVPLPEPQPQRCVSSTQCEAGLTCSTERGDCLSCNAPEGQACPAVCYGVCEKAPMKAECQTDTDCKVVDNYCGGCNCLAVSAQDTVSACSDPVACFVAPCQGKSAVCHAGQCVVAPLPRR